ncbi:integrase arm-type DNA-binding domain-containing protein [Acetobacter orientalis]|uniref:tyrosine-type recombinase/integrase n=1 Tax=Acetobacter orientalis TaxID=146474 RepID=UPI0020A25500|nr:integrase arm-type DNA-binding domain-containing protein [Acetobacter orientalis]
MGKTWVKFSSGVGKTAKVADKPYRLTDSEGLFLHVMATGKRYWRVRYRANGKEQTLTLGSYPELGLKDARHMRDKAKEMLKSGIDPNQNEKLFAVQSDTRKVDILELVAREWFDLRKDPWRPRHAHDVINSLERDVFPLIGSLSPSKITARLTLHALKQIEERGAVETAHRIRQRMSEIFVHAIATDRCDLDPVQTVRAARRLQYSNRITMCW